MSWLDKIIPAPTITPAQLAAVTAVAERPVMERTKEKITEAPRHDKATLEADIEHLRKKSATLLGVELQAKNDIGAHITKCQTLLHQEALRDEIGDLKVVDPIVLSWRHEEVIEGHKVKVPSLALYSLDEPSVKFNVTWSGHTDWRPALPAFLMGMYQDVENAIAQVLARKDVNRDSCSLTTTFKGVIPMETKEKIASTKHNFEEIRLLAEVPSWTKVVSLAPDPIVVGIAGKAMWVIDVFDPTPVEDYVASEFTS